MIIGFLEHLETDRHNSARSRNARLAAIRSCFRYAALRHPDHAALIQQVLAIPQKRFDKALVSYLTQPEIDALLAAPDTHHMGGTPRRRSHRSGRPDRPDESLNWSTWTAATSTWGSGGYVTLHRARGGRERTTPLAKTTRALLGQLAPRNATGQPTDPLFPGRTGRRVQRGAIERRVIKYRTLATSRRLLVP